MLKVALHGGDYPDMSSLPTDQLIGNAPSHSEYNHALVGDITTSDAAKLVKELNDPTFASSRTTRRRDCFREGCNSVLASALAPEAQEPASLLPI
jgi:hypothetical protein